MPHLKDQDESDRQDRLEEKPMYAIELYVPEFDNDRQQITVDHWAYLESELVKIDGGWTRYHALGRWGGQIENVIVYRVLGLAFTPDQRGQVGQIAAYVKEHWQQKSVVWTLIETAEINFT